MNQRSWVRLFLAGVLLLIARALHAEPQDPPHRFIEPPSDSPLDEEGFSARVRDFSEQRDERRDLNEIVRAIKNNRNLLEQFKGADIDRLGQQARQDPRFKDPKFRAAIKNAVESNNLSDEQRAALQKATEPTTRTGTGDGPTPSKTEPDRPKTIAEEARDRGRSTDTGARSPDADWLNQQAAHRLNSLVQMLDRNSNVRNSERLRDAVRQLTSQNLINRNLQWHNPTSIDLASGLGRLGKYLTADRSSAIDGLGKLPSTPNLGFAASESGHSLSNNFFGGSAGAGGGKILALVLAALVAIVIAWQILALRLRASSRRVQVGWQLGPWPVDPQRIASRGDLVRAFEYLACLLLGPDARHRHHRALAEQIAARNPTPARQTAAADLGLLYEQARYAPPDEPLPEACLAAARRDLSLLAEASA